MRRALELQPDYALFIYLTGLLDLIRGRREATVTTADRLAAAVTRELQAGLLAGTLYAMVQDAERTAEVLAPVYRESPTASNIQLIGSLYGWALRALGRPDEADRVWAETEAFARERISLGDENPVHPYSLAVIHAHRGERDEALRRFAEAESRGWHAVGAIEIEPALDVLRDDPRFREIVGRMEATQQDLRATVVREGW